MNHYVRENGKGRAITLRKRCLTILLSFCMMLTLPPNIALAADDPPTSGKCGDNINWYLQKDGTLLLDGSGETYYYGEEPAPWAELANQINFIRVQGKITRLGGGLFEECYEARGIYLPKYLEQIGSLALPQYGRLQYFMIEDNSGEFVVHDHVLYSDHGKTLYMYPPALTDTSFTLPAGVTRVSSFGGNLYLQKVTLSEGLLEIENCAFEYCSNLREVVIPSSVTTIGKFAFDECICLKEIAIPSGVTELDFSVFWFCDQLDTIVIPASVRTLTAGCSPADGCTRNYDVHKDFYFFGDAPDFDDAGGFGDLSMGYVNSDASHIRTDIYYPVNASGWANVIRKFEGLEEIRFHSYDPNSDGQLHGTVTASLTYAPSGETVTLRVLPDPGYRLDFIEVTSDEDGRRVPLSGGGNTYTFSMPAFDVTVRTRFTKNVA